MRGVEIQHNMKSETDKYKTVNDKVSAKKIVINRKFDITVSLSYIALSPPTPPISTEALLFFPPAYINLKQALRVIKSSSSLQEICFGSFLNQTMWK